MRGIEAIGSSVRPSSARADKFGGRSVTGVAGFFFFSSRRRHTRFDCDWSSDVCSSDLSVLSQEYLARLFFSVPAAPGLGAARFYRLQFRPGALNLLQDILEFRRPDERSRILIPRGQRSEEHTSELQSQSNLVCRLLLEAKKLPPIPYPAT